MTANTCWRLYILRVFTAIYTVSPFYRGNENDDFTNPVIFISKYEFRYCTWNFLFRIERWHNDNWRFIYDHANKRLACFFLSFLEAACSYLKPCYPGYCTSNACMCTNNFSPQSSGTSNCLTCEIRFIMRILYHLFNFLYLF